MAILSTGRRDGPIRVRVRLFLHVALRLADQVGLGVDVSRSRCGKHLHVLQILRHGAKRVDEKIGQLEKASPASLCHCGIAMR